MRFRKLSLKLHQIAGVMAGILLVIIGLTGSILVFHNEIDSSLYPQMLQVVPQREQRISLKSALDKVESAYPNLKLASITLPEKPDKPYQVGTTSKKDEWIDIYLNPYTGEILGSKQWGRTFITFIYDIHISLLAGEIGGKVVGICGLILLLLGITGLTLWNGWRKLALGFKVRWNSPTHLLNYDIHKVGGILSVAFLILSASTGTALLFHEQFEPGLYWLTNTPTPTIPKSTIVAGKRSLEIDRVLAKANTVLPEAETTFINLPQKPDAVFRITKKFPEELHPSGRTRLYLDRYSGEVLLVENAREAPLAKRLLNILFPVHSGLYGGLGMRILYVFIGLMPTVLFVTGWKMWWQGKWAKAQRKEIMRSRSVSEEESPSLE